MKHEVTSREFIKTTAGSAATASFTIASHNVASDKTAALSKPASKKR